ncbi:hypothetical protein SAMN06265795_105224 [Noviherbaspirillum humi]|uniref:Phasin protein n=1 Tax=Noviherbaspirillum humi TaxID=1688639 RepID=A0A239GW03_9BURK|nr:polyhydroxyalkanoate granule-associated phasin [Noviherbaspirillum humi]SNS73406.1 hypothetical protein SAMN06265795_105224 [Noviherbaspirillum humi]
MPSPRPFNMMSPLDTAWPWIDVGWKQGEMMLASAQVISHRLGRMVTAGVFPDARDRKEFHRMGSEKIEAAAESFMAMSMRLIESNQSLLLLLLAQIPAAMLASLMPAKQNWSGLHGPWWGMPGTQLLKNFSEVGEHFTTSMIELAGVGLQPIHRRATANAVRLAGVQRRKKSR